MVATGFRGRVRAAWRVRRLFSKEIVGTVEVAIDFIRGDMVEAEGLLCCLIEGGPVVTGRFQQGKGANQVGLDKSGRTVNRAVNMAFGSGCITISG